MDLDISKALEKIVIREAFFIFFKKEKNYKLRR